jgi:DNA-directed RNA polymerase subunit RPC12/RpoP
LIIACPECTSPFQVLDDQIAPLLQIECPTCSFRMILDFAAANDAGLRENGMQYAQGFLDEASYRMAVGGEVSYAPTTEQPAAKPELRAVPEPEPTIEPEPEPEPQTPPTWTPAVAEPEPEPERPAPVQPQPEPARAKPPVRARPTLIAHTAPPPVRQPAELIPPRPTAEVQPAEASIDTHVGPAPHAEVAAPVEVPRPADDAQLEVPADEFSVDLDEPEPEVQVARPRPQPIERPIEPAIQHAELRTPPHTPATPSTTKPIPDETGDEAPEVDSKTPQPEQTGKKGGALRTVFLMLLLLVLMGAAGLMGWSVIETQDPNPLPMLKQKFGIDLGFGIPPEAPAEPAADEAATDKAGGQ